MSDSDDEYGPPLPPGMGRSSKEEGSAAATDMIGPVCPPGFTRKDNSTSDSDSDSSSSDEDMRHRHKKKSKKKRHHSSSDSDAQHSSKKKRKHKHSSSDSDSSGDDRRKHSHKEERTSRVSIGPVLPSSHPSSHQDSSSRSIGPSLPPGLASGQMEDDLDDSDDDIGPRIDLQVKEGEISAVQEFVERNEKLSKKNTESTDDGGPQQRESWMTELPTDMGARFGLGPRQFRKGEAAEQDDSWTETPQEKANKKDGKKKKKDKDKYFQSEADKMAAKQIEDYNKKHRSESLLDMHKKELKKKKKKEKKKNKGKEKVKERVPFDRERDLKVNKLDEAQRKAIIKRSQELGSRFKSGGTGTSFL